MNFKADVIPEIIQRLERLEKRLEALEEKLKQGHEDLKYEIMTVADNVNNLRYGTSNP